MTQMLAMMIKMIGVNDDSNDESGDDINMTLVFTLMIAISLVLTSMMMTLVLTMMTMTCVGYMRSSMTGIFLYSVIMYCNFLKQFHSCLYLFPYSF